MPIPKPAEVKTPSPNQIEDMVYKRLMPECIRAIENNRGWPVEVFYFKGEQEYLRSIISALAWKGWYVEIWSGLNTLAIYQDKPLPFWRRLFR